MGKFEDKEEPVLIVAKWVEYDENKNFAKEEEIIAP